MKNAILICKKNLTCMCNSMKMNVNIVYNDAIVKEIWKFDYVSKV